MFKKRISFADHAWLRMDDPNNLMVITALMTFDTPLDYARLKRLVQDQLFRFRRFRQRLVPSRFPFRRPYWEDDPCFDLEAHIERVTLPPPYDQKALQDLISQLMSTGLDYTRPLWKFYLVENYGSGSAFIARLHHSIADGIALMQVLLSMTEPAPEDFLRVNLKSFHLNGDQAAASGGQPAKELTGTFKSKSMAKKMDARDFLEEGIWTAASSLSCPWIALTRGSISLRQLGNWHCAA